MANPKTAVAARRHGQRDRSGAEAMQAAAVATAIATLVHDGSTDGIQSATNAPPTKAAAVAHFPTGRSALGDDALCIVVSRHVRSAVCKRGARAGFHFVARNCLALRARENPTPSCGIG
jgi:hypothetical protein